MKKIKNGIQFIEEGYKNQQEGNFLIPNQLTDDELNKIKAGEDGDEFCISKQFCSPMGKTSCFIWGCGQNYEPIS